MSVLRAELFSDAEAGTWHYRVPALRINGGGAAAPRAPQTVTADPAHRA